MVGDQDTYVWGGLAALLSLACVRVDARTFAAVACATLVVGLFTPIPPLSSCKGDDEERTPPAGATSDAVAAAIASSHPPTITASSARTGESVPNPRLSNNTTATGAQSEEAEAETVTVDTQAPLPPPQTTPYQGRRSAESSLRLYQAALAECLLRH